jgi:hypothetical protein
MILLVTRAICAPTVKNKEWYSVISSKKEMYRVCNLGNRECLQGKINYGTIIEEY